VASGDAPRIVPDERTGASCRGRSGGFVEAPGPSGRALLSIPSTGQVRTSRAMAVRRPSGPGCFAPSVSKPRAAPCRPGGPRRASLRLMSASTSRTSPRNSRRGSSVPARLCAEAPARQSPTSSERGSRRGRRGQRHQAVIEAVALGLQPIPSRIAATADKTDLPKLALCQPHPVDVTTRGDRIASS